VQPGFFFAAGVHSILAPKIDDISKKIKKSKNQKNQKSKNQKLITSLYRPTIQTN